jgi:hypothetical protein
MDRTQFITYSVLFAVVFSPAGWSQTNEALKSSVILLRSPDSDEDCTENDKTKAVSWGNENVVTRIGDHFQIVTHRSGVMSSTLVDTCKPERASSRGMLLFRARDYLDWEGSYDALLAVKGQRLQSDQAGSVSWIRLNPLHRTAVISALKGRIPESDTTIMGAGTIISPPHSTRLYLFVSVEHYDLQQYMGAGDKAIASMGLLFEILEKDLPLLTSERSLTNVYSISDIDNDGIWELLTQSGDWGGGTYQLRFFNGSRFLIETLELYEWSH